MNDKLFKAILLAMVILSMYTIFSIIFSPEVSRLVSITGWFFVFSVFTLLFYEA